MKSFFSLLSFFVAIIFVIFSFDLTLSFAQEKLEEQKEKIEKKKASPKNCAKMYLMITRLDQELYFERHELEKLRSLLEEEKEEKNYYVRQEDFDKREAKLEAMKLEYVQYDCDTLGSKKEVIKAKKGKS